MNHFFRAFAFLVTIAVPSLAWAYDIAVMPVKGVNLQPGQPEAIGVLLANEYAKASGYQVAKPEVVRGVLKEGSDYAAAARALRAGEYLESVCVALESKLVFSVERHDSNTGKTIHSVSMTGVNMDDVQEVSQRLSRALLLKTTPEETRTLDTVTKAESQPTNQTYSLVPKGIKSAITMPFVRGVDVDPMASLAFELRIEKREFFLGMAVGLMLGSNMGDSRHHYNAGFLEFSGNYFLTQGNFAPYVGIGVSPRLQSANQLGVGFAPFAHVGAMFPRESRARGFVEFRLAQNVLPFPQGSTSQPVYDESTSLSTYRNVPHPLGGKYPTEGSLQFGIVW